MSEMLDAALIYLSMGWCVYPVHSVDPESGFCTCGRKDCPAPGKHPIGRWADFQNRLPTEREVELWFSSMDCNIGTVTGRVSGIVVVDVDGGQGQETLKGLTLDPTLTAKTGGGGLHLFYELDRPVSSRVRALEGIDIRADGGFVVLPPSIHKSGKRYRWLEPQGLALYDPEPFDNPLQRYVTEGGWQDELLQGVGEGERSVTAARLSGRYANLGLSFDETCLILVGWNQRNEPPLDERELLRTVRAVYAKHASTHTFRIQTLEQIGKLLKWSDNGR